MFLSSIKNVADSIEMDIDDYTTPSLLSFIAVLKINEPF
jgi:hypothetical protein